MGSVTITHASVSVYMDLNCPPKTFGNYSMWNLWVAWGSSIWDWRWLSKRLWMRYEAPYMAHKVFALSRCHSRGDEFAVPSRRPSFPLKSLVADSNNKLQSDQSMPDQLETLKSLRMRGWGKKSICNLHQADECWKHWERDSFKDPGIITS